MITIAIVIINIIILAVLIRRIILIRKQKNSYKLFRDFVLAVDTIVLEEDKPKFRMCFIVRKLDGDKVLVTVPSQNKFATIDYNQNGNYYITEYHDTEPLQTV